MVRPELQMAQLWRECGVTLRNHVWRKGIERLDSIRLYLDVRNEIDLADKGIKLLDGILLPVFFSSFFWSRPYIIRLIFLLGRRESADDGAHYLNRGMAFEIFESPGGQTRVHICLR